MRQERRRSCYHELKEEACESRLYASGALVSLPGRFECLTMFKIFKVPALP